MSEVQDKVVIITGASSGLGEETARMLAKKGAKLMLAARREDRLKELTESIKKDGGQADGVQVQRDMVQIDSVQGHKEKERERYTYVHRCIYTGQIVPFIGPTPTQRMVLTRF